MTKLISLVSFFLGGGDRERQSMNGGGAERERHRIGNRLQAPSHQPRARRGAQTHRPRDRDLTEVGRLTDCATQAPQEDTVFTEVFERLPCCVEDGADLWEGHGCVLWAEI